MKVWSLQVQGRNVTDVYKRRVGQSLLGYAPLSLHPTYLDFNCRQVQGRNLTYN